MANDGRASAIAILVEYSSEAAVLSRSALVVEYSSEAAVLSRTALVVEYSDVPTTGQVSTSALVVEYSRQETELASSALVVEYSDTPTPGSLARSALVVEYGTAAVGPASELRITAAVLEVLCGRVPAPEDLVVSRYTDIDEAKIGRDLVLPGLGGTDPVPPTLTGDWPSIAGRANLHAAVRRRLVTAPGQLVHRPEYGGGLPLFVGTLASPSERARLAAGARGNLLRDPRIGAVQVGVGEPPGMPSAVLVEVAVQPVGETSSETVSVIATGS